MNLPVHEILATNQDVQVRAATDIGDADDATIDGWELAASRRALGNLRTLLNGRPMLDLIADQVDASTSRYRRYASESEGRFRGGHVLLTLTGITVKELFSMVSRLMKDAGGTAEAREAASLEFLFPSHPEHYGLAAGSVGVVETMGGSPTLTHVSVIDPEEAPEDVRSHMDPSYDVSTVGRGLLDDDETVQSYVVQQFKDTDDGMVADLWIFYPQAAPASDVEEHLRHYAVEFRNGARLAAAARRTGA